MPNRRHPIYEHGHEEVHEDAVSVIHYSAYAVVVPTNTKVNTGLPTVHENLTRSQPDVVRKEDQGIEQDKDKQKEDNIGRKGTIVVDS